MLFPATTLVSDCCRAIIVMDGSEHQCTKCLKHCQRGGTLAGLAAPQEERERLEREVIEAAKAEREAQKAYLERLNFTTSEVHHNALTRRTNAIDALIEFESQHLLKK